MCLLKEVFSDELYTGKKLGLQMASLVEMHKM